MCSLRRIGTRFGKNPVPHAALLEQLPVEFADAVHEQGAQYISVKTEFHFRILRRNNHLFQAFSSHVRALENAAYFLRIHRNRHQNRTRNGRRFDFRIEVKQNG